MDFEIAKFSCNDFVESIPAGYASFKVEKGVCFIEEYNSQFSELMEEKIFKGKANKIAIVKELALTDLFTKDNVFPKNIEVKSQKLGRYFNLKITSPKQNYFSVFATDITAQTIISQRGSSIFETTSNNIDYFKICDEIRIISKAKYVSFNLFEPNGRDFTTVAVSGIGENIKKAYEILGFKAEGKKWSYNASRYNAINENDIICYDSLKEVTGEVLPKSVVGMIEKTFDIGKVYVASIRKDTKILGDCTLIMDKQSSIGDEQNLRIYLNQIGHILYKIQSEKTIQENSENFRSLFETIDDIIIISDKTGAIKKTNSSAINKTGYSEKELYLMNILDLHPIKEIEKAKEMFNAVLNGESNTCALPLVRKDGSYIDVETRVWPGDWNGEECILCVSKDMSAELSALHKFNKVFDKNPSLMSINLLPNRKFNDVSSSFLEKLGYTKEEVLGKTIEELTLFTDNAVLEKIYKEIREKGKVDETVIKIKTKTGKILKGIFEGETIKNNREKYFISVFTDMTKQFELNKKIEEQKKRYENIIEGTHLGTWEWDIQTGKTVFNERWANIIGYTLEELSPITIETWTKNTHEDDLKESERLLKEHFEGKLDYYESECRMRHKSGEWIWVLDRGKVTEWSEDGKPLKMFGTHADITERKMLETELSQFFTLNLDLLCIANTDGYFIRVNKSWEEILGYPQDEFVGKKFLDFVHPDDLEETINAVSQLNKQEKLNGFINRYIKKDGTYRYIEWRATPYDNLIYAAARDITDRIDYEKRLEERDNLLSKLSSQIPGVIYQFRYYPNGHSCFPFASEGIYDVYEVMPSEVKHDASKVFQRLYTEDAEGVKKSIIHSFDTLEMWEYEYRVQLPQKGIRWLRGKANPQRLSDSSVLWHGYIEDITKNKLLEEELLKTHQQFSLAVKGSHDGIWDWDISSDKLFLSPRWKEILGYEDNEIKNEFASFENNIIYEDKNRVIEHVNSYFKGEIEEYNIEFRMRHKNGSIVWILARGEALRDVFGIPYRMAGSHTDITERKRIEAELAENEKRFRYALAGANEGLWDWNIETGEVFYSERWCKMLDYEMNEIDNNIKSWQELIHPEDKASFREKLNRHLDGTTEHYQDAQRLKKKDGSYIWILNRGMVVERDRKGYPKRMVGTNSDIHIRRMLEDKVRRDLEEKQASIMKAQEVQKRLNTKKIPKDDNIRISALYMPSEELSGDFFNVIKTKDDSKMVLFLGDSTGHGIEASMDATLLKSICDRHIEILEEGESTDKFISLVNRDISKYSIEEKYPTLFASVIDLNTLNMTYSSANAPLPLVICDNPYPLEKVDGFHLGFFEEIKYGVNHINIKGKRLLLFSDSIYEFFDKNDILFDLERFKAICKNTLGSGREYISNIISSLGSLTSLPLDDDLTLILIESKEPYKCTISVSDCRKLEEYINEFREKLHDFSSDNEQTEKVCVVLHELGTNAIRHGNKYSTEKKVTIEIEVTAARAQMRVSDEGDGFNRKSLRDPTDFEALLNLLEEGNEKEYTHGRGVWLSEQYTNRLTYNEKGNSVLAVIYFSESGVLFGK